MDEYEDKIVHEVGGIQEYGNPAPGWLMWLLYGAIIFAVLYVAWYALSFGDHTYDAGYRAEKVSELARVQKHFAENPLVPPTAEALLAGVADPAVLEAGRDRFFKTCASCHGEAAQGLIGPNLTDDHWLHGGKVTEIFQTIVKGVPAKGMPPWGRALAPEELAALTSYVRSLQGSGPANARGPEGPRVEPEPLPKAL
jgi:cytochrome c oxidase cbb3-type subunit 3